ncbi:MFS general substrate transporter [Ophiobolus disseminans]|uniref:MFS general substrate transporter n=1 Tax=Ophiobolus disseminans TaxID=1469910 RepID=A0A6A6ZYE4_9PLEO|nr:MFS general substrate transporter [Ophiobolus disseminans]
MFALTFLSIELALLMTLWDSTIVSTSVVAITNDLGGYVKSSWLFTSYLLKFGGFPIIWAKASDIVGRKPCLLASMVIFMVFSGACGAAQTFLQLIMFRWLQGIGAAGIFSLTLVFFELIPPSKYAISTSVTSTVISLSFLMGPLVGGAITSSGITWRWIFLLSVMKWARLTIAGLPVLAFAVIVLLVFSPKQLSRESLANRPEEPISERMKRFDILGGTMLLGITVPLTTALQQASEGLSFGSTFVWPLLLVTAFFLVGFLTWQWYTTTRRTIPEPVFPWRFLIHRASIGIILNTFLSGCVMTVCVVQIPQRFIVLYGMSPLAAGIRLLPFAMMTPVGSIWAALLLDRKLVTPNALLLVGGALQTIGVTLFATLTAGRETLPRQYGFQVLIGIGIGFVSTATFLLGPLKMEERDLAVGTGTVAQFRLLGGAIALAVVTCASTPLLRNTLLEAIPPEQTRAILERLKIMPSLPESMQAHVRTSFQRGFEWQMTILIGFAAAHIPVGFAMLREEGFLGMVRLWRGRRRETARER